MKPGTAATLCDPALTEIRDAHYGRLGALYAGDENAAQPGRSHPLVCEKKQLRFEARLVGMRLDAFDAAAQTRKRVRACAGHAPLPPCWAITGSLVNPQSAHLFMICSNIKLTWPGESIGIGG